MAYTPQELKDLFRHEVDDMEAPGDGDDTDSLWSDQEIFSYMDFAQTMFAELTEYLVDSSTAAICTVAVTADDPWIDIDPRVIRIMRARAADTGYVLQCIKQQDAEHMYMGDDYGQALSATHWEDSAGDPVYIITDMQTDRGRLVPVPEASTTLSLTVVRRPLVQVKKSTTALEVTNTQYQLALLDGMKWRAYLKQDADALNIKLANQYEAQFRSKCDEIKNAHRLKTKPGHAIRYGGIPMS